MDWRVCLGAALLAACFVKPGPPGVGADATSGGPGDDSRAGDSSLLLGCAHVGLHVDFVGMQIQDCGGSWATTAGSVSAGSNSPLVMSTLPLPGGSCTSKTASTGGYIKLAAIPPTPGDSLFLAAILPSSQVTMRIVNGTGLIELLGPEPMSMAGYTPQVQWLRLMSQGPASLVGEYSFDGVHWALVGMQSTGGAPIDTMHMEFGVKPGGSGGGSGLIDEYDECR